MPQPEITKNEGEVIRISLRWILLTAVTMLLLGILGGIIAILVWPPIVSPLVQEMNPALPAIQEIKIMPNEARKEALQRTDRSIVMISRAEDLDPIPLMTGVIVTNDGVIVTPNGLPGSKLVAIDFTGQAWPVERMGDDNLYGLSYLRLTNGVWTPSDIAADALPVGEELLLLSRSSESFELKVRSIEIEEHKLPGPEVPLGQQKIMQTSGRFGMEWLGGAIMDAEGKLAAIMARPEAGEAIFAGDVKDSLERLTQGKRELNPLDLLGFRIDRDFESRAGKPVAFTVRASLVTPKSKAALADLRIGDVIKKINQTEVQWETNIIKLLSSNQTIILTVERAGVTQEITLR